MGPYHRPIDGKPMARPFGFACRLPPRRNNPPQSSGDGADPVNLLSINFDYLVTEYGVFRKKD